MQQQTTEGLRAWFRNIEPVYAELFSAAHLICGNYDLAEYALRSAIMDVWLQDASGGMGFRERLRASLRQEAFEAALSDEGADAEFTWPGIPPAGDGEAIQTQLSQERVETQRLVMLRHGCGLSTHDISRLTGASRGQIRAELDRFTARCRRELTGHNRVRTEALIARRARRLLARGDADLPHPAQVYRAFEAEAGGAQFTGHRATRAIGAVVSALLALLCAVAFWLYAVLAHY